MLLGQVDLGEGVGEVGQAAVQQYPEPTHLVGGKRHVVVRKLLLLRI